MARRRPLPDSNPADAHESMILSKTARRASGDTLSPRHFVCTSKKSPFLHTIPPTVNLVKPLRVIIGFLVRYPYDFDCIDLRSSRVTFSAPSGHAYLPCSMFSLTSCRIHMFLGRVPPLAGRSRARLQECTQCWSRYSSTSKNIRRSE